MTQLFDLASCSGKNILRAENADDRVFFFFDDDTYIIISSNGWEDHYSDVDHEDWSMTPSEYNASDLLRLGIIGQAEYNSLMLAVKDKRESERKAQELGSLRS